MKQQKKRQNNHGFTLTEMLVAVAIVVVLFSLALIPIGNLYRDVRQTALDSKAELIFTAAQNQLTQLQAAGQQDAYRTGAAALDSVPMDAEEGRYDPEDLSLVYISSADKDRAGSAAGAVLPAGKIEQELRDAHWIVEYDADSGSVYAVFYSEAEMDYNTAAFDSLRYRNQRIKGGAVIGYYGGDAVGAYETGTLEPRLEVVNGEQLYIRTICNTQVGAKLQFTVTLTDEDGHRAEVKLSSLSGEVVQSGITYTATLMLDDLREDGTMRFAQQSRFSNLTPGQDLNISVKVTSNDELIDQAVVSAAGVNSLFAEVRRDDGDRTAVITHARHLQNLDEDSGVNRGAPVTAAVQEQDIQFSAATDDSWEALYHGRTFRPIRNAFLKSYLSSCLVGDTEYHPVIYDLPVRTTGDAGLFETFAGGTLRHIRLSGAKITGGGNVGGLAGTVSGDVSIDSCQVFLSPAKGHTAAMEQWLSGSTTGGLIGRTNGGSVTIENSFAATVLEGSTAAGGLVGHVQADVRAVGAYADCYIYSGTAGGAAGGLIGTRSAGAIALQNCYAAGFLSGDSTAGLSVCALGSGDSLRNLYTACAPLEEDVLLSYATAPQAASGAPQVENVYYLSESQSAAHLDGSVFVSYTVWSGDNRADAAQKLGDAFTADTGDTYAYNLISGMGLSLYSYPKLKDLPHYGDWKAEFESGSPVYYEKYADGSYGFYGANVSTLSANAVISGDGYGMIYADHAPGTVHAASEGLHATLNGADAIPITVRTKGEDKTYYLLPLGADFVQDAPQTGRFYRTLEVDGSTYFYNPHFANTAVAGTEAPTTPERITLRTARHLYTLSCHYDDYAKFLPAKAAWMQEHSIDYTTYDWANYGPGGKAVAAQRPIGQADSAPFAHTYNGGSYPITGVSFAGSATGLYAGLFGCSTGELRNIVLVSNVPLDQADTASVRIGSTAQFKTVYMGMLAGRNGGSIYNCAAAGYDMECHAYSGSTFYIGGLVGYNAGSIRNSSVSAPRISGSGTFATICAGGFAGGSSGQIRQCYALASVKFMAIRGGDVTIAGFTGYNVGSIRSSYCATALNSAGAVTYGFSPDAGSVTDCSFLDGGTYSFAGEVYLYHYSAGTSGAKGVTDDVLAAQYISGFHTVDAAHSLYHPNTGATSGISYPYPSSVTNGGTPVHYGDWIIPAELGTLGMVYWEYESGGTNSGFHFSFVGFDHGEEKSGSSLCSAHDDGGTISRYGYGYYWKSTEPAAVLSASVQNGAFRLGAPMADVAQALEEQLQGYTFVAYETGSDGLHLESPSAANGIWTLTQTDAHSTVAYTFSVCPFFADAYSCTSHGTTVLPGSDERPYQVRSVAQLQYINWSVDGTGSAVRDVTSANYQSFPYLQYATVTGQGAQTRANAEANRPAQSWLQTHDVNGASASSPSDPTKNQTFHPIAGAVEHMRQESYTMVLYNWFGGKYDGQSYYIKNVNINSYCYNVGVFGTTAGADIRNIVLYSDNHAVIQRNTLPSSWDYQDRGTPADPREYICSYALGGLVGIAYDYQDNLGKGTVANCSIAGYTVADNSQNALQLGEAGIGGLIGVSSVNLRNCSAVVDLQINCTHRWKADGSLNSALWGNFIRVGGLVGGLRYAATDCYTGGSITVSPETLKERIVSGDNSNQNFADGSRADKIKWSQTRGGYVGSTYNKNLNPATYVYIGGVGGSGFSANFYNFTNKASSDDGTPTFNNCYTYIDLPDMEGTITGICLIGSAADRFKYAKAVVNNCYYLDSTMESVGFGKLSKSINPNGASLYTLLNTQQARSAMLNGDLSYLKNYLWENSAQKNTTNGLTGLSYAQMASRNGGAAITKANSTDTARYDRFTDALGSGFSWVTITEGGATIHGKYSFPGEDAALQGQDYPFPTVLTQTDTFGETVHLHYGSWPKSGLFWSEGIASMDLIADYREDLMQSGIQLQLALENVSSAATATELPTFQYTDAAVVEATAAWESDGVFNVWLKGLQPGATEVTASFGGYTARLTLTVTAELTILAEPHIVEQYVGDSQTVTLKALDRKGTVRPVTWHITNEDETLAEVTLPIAAADSSSSMQVKGLSEGETALHITALCQLSNGTSYTGTTALSIITHAQGILGAANMADSAALIYREGTMNKALNGWEEGKGYGDAAYTTGAPECSAPLFLYGKGSHAKLSNFTVSTVTVRDASGVYDVLSDLSRYNVLFGEIESTDAYTCRPITVRGLAAGSIELAITLQDQRTGAAYTLTIPYTLTEADTKVAATFTNLQGTEISRKDLPYGTAAGIPAQEVLEQLRAETVLPEGYEFADLTADTGWTPSVTAPLYADTTFAPLTRRSGHTITFAGIGVEQSQIILDKGESITGTQWPDVPAREGYKFLGWTTDGTDLYSGTSLYTPTADTTFKAKWRKLVTIEVYNLSIPAHTWSNVSAYDTGYSGNFSSSESYRTYNILAKIDGKSAASECTKSWNYWNNTYTYTVTIDRSQFPADEW